MFLWKQTLFWHRRLIKEMFILSQLASFIFWNVYFRLQGLKLIKKILSSFKATTSFLPLTIPPLYKSCRQESYQEIESRVINYLLLRLSTKSWPNIWSVVVEGNNIVPIEHCIKYFHLFPAEFGRLGGVVQRRLGVVLQRRLGVVLQRRGRGWSKFTLLTLRARRLCDRLLNCHSKLQPTKGDSQKLDFCMSNEQIIRQSNLNRRS